MLHQPTTSIQPADSTSMLRAIPTAAHSQEDIQHLVKSLCEMKEFSHAAPAIAAVPPAP